MYIGSHAGDSITPPRRFHCLWASCRYPVCLVGWIVDWRAYFGPSTPVAWMTSPPAIDNWIPFDCQVNFLHTSSTNFGPGWGHDHVGLTPRRAGHLHESQPAIFLW